MKSLPAKQPFRNSFCSKAPSSIFTLSDRTLKASARRACRRLCPVAPFTRLLRLLTLENDEFTLETEGTCGLCDVHDSAMRRLSPQNWSVIYSGRPGVTSQRAKKYHRRTYASICICMRTHTFTHIHICAHPAASVFVGVKILLCNIHTCPCPSAQKTCKIMQHSP